MKPMPLLAAMTVLGPLASLQAQQANGDAKPVNLALKKTFVSSNENKYGWAGLTDGSWRSGGRIYATGDDKIFPKTVTLDLEAPASVGYVATGTPPYGSTRTVALLLSMDGTTFNEAGRYAFTLKQEERHIFEIPATTARYVRLVFVDNYPESVDYPPSNCFLTEMAVFAPGPKPVLPPIIPPEVPDAPAPKYDANDNLDAGFQAQHLAFLNRGKAGPIGVLFIGDSITAGWSWGKTKEIWEKYYGPFQAANFGIAGDRTQHVLWRIANGELEGISPKVVVLLIGTNNIGNKTEDITKGDIAVINEIHRRLPNAKLLLLAIFPRGAETNNMMRTKIKVVNSELAKLDDGTKTRYLDLGPKFLAPEGTISKDIMADGLHPTPAGYQIWADAMQPLLDEMMK